MEENVRGSLVGQTKQALTFTWPRNLDSLFPRSPLHFPPPLPPNKYEKTSLCCAILRRPSALQVGEILYFDEQP